MSKRELIGTFGSAALGLASLLYTPEARADTTNIISTNFLSTAGATYGFTQAVNTNIVPHTTNTVFALNYTNAEPGVSYTLQRRPFLDESPNLNHQWKDVAKRKADDFGGLYFTIGNLNPVSEFFRAYSLSTNTVEITTNTAPITSTNGVLNGN